MQDTSECKSAIGLNSNMSSLNIIQIKRHLQSQWDEQRKERRENTDLICCKTFTLMGLNSKEMSPNIKSMDTSFSPIFTGLGMHPPPSAQTGYNIKTPSSLLGYFGIGVKVGGAAIVSIIPKKWLLNSVNQWQWTVPLGYFTTLCVSSTDLETAVLFLGLCELCVVVCVMVELHKILNVLQQSWWYHRFRDSRPSSRTKSQYFERPGSHWETIVFIFCNPQWSDLIQCIKNQIELPIGSFSTIFRVQCVEDSTSSHTVEVLPGDNDMEHVSISWHIFTPKIKVYTLTKQRCF